MEDSKKERAEERETELLLSELKNSSVEVPALNLGLNLRMTPRQTRILLEKLEKEGLVSIRMDESSDDRWIYSFRMGPKGISNVCLNEEDRDKTKRYVSLTDKGRQLASAI